MRGAHASLALCFLLALGCDDDRGRIDGGPSLDAGRGIDSGATLDAGATADAGPDSKNPGDAGARDAGPRDSGLGSDAGPAIDGGTGPVQCRVNADCGSGRTCERHWPGGICADVCPGNGCPSGFECQGSIPACVRACAGPSDCNVGLECRTGSGRCGSMSCTPGGPDVCAPYVCNGAENRCERPRCAGGASCPSPFVCVDDFCVEP